MALNNMNVLYGAWRAQTTALTFDFKEQTCATRFRRHLNVRVQHRLKKNGANRKVMLGVNHTPRYIYPRGTAWERVAELSGL